MTVIAAEVDLLSRFILCFIRSVDTIGYRMISAQSLPRITRTIYTYELKVVWFPLI